MVNNQEINRLIDVAKAAQGVYACILTSAADANDTSYMAMVCRVIKNTTQFEKLQKALDDYRAAAGELSHPWDQWR